MGLTYWWWTWGQLAFGVDGVWVDGMQVGSGQNVPTTGSPTPERRRPLYALVGSSGLSLVVILGPQRLERDTPVIGRTEFPPGTAPTRPSFSPSRQLAPVHHPIPIKHNSRARQGHGRSSNRQCLNVQKVNKFLSSSSNTPPLPDDNSSRRPETQNNDGQEAEPPLALVS